jgi:hypothetical protein
MCAIPGSQIFSGKSPAVPAQINGVDPADANTGLTQVLLYSNGMTPHSVEWPRRKLVEQSSKVELLSAANALEGLFWGNTWLIYGKFRALLADLSAARHR